MNDQLTAIEKIYQEMVQLEKQGLTTTEAQQRMEQLQKIAVKIKRSLKQTFRKSNQPASEVVNDAIREMINQGLMANPADANWKEGMIAQADTKIKAVMTDLFKDL